MTAAPPGGALRCTRQTSVDGLATVDGQRLDGGPGHCESMPSTPEHNVLMLPKGLCHKCLRVLSRRLRDLPGVVWLQIDAATGQVQIAGDVDLAAAEAVVGELNCS